MHSFSPTAEKQSQNAVPVASGSAPSMQRIMFGNSTLLIFQL